MRLRPVDQEESMGMARKEPRGRAMGERIEESSAPILERRRMRLVDVYFPVLRVYYGSSVCAMSCEKWGSK